MNNANKWLKMIIINIMVLKLLRQIIKWLWPEKILRPKKARLFPYRYDSDDRAEFKSACWEQKLYPKNTQEWIKLKKIFKPLSTGMTHFRATFLK